MRYLPDVIDEMLKKVPSSETDFISQLESRKTSAQFAAPEMMETWWLKTADVLVEVLGNEMPISGWKKDIANIWMDVK